MKTSTRRKRKDREGTESARELGEEKEPRFASASLAFLVGCKAIAIHRQTVPKREVWGVETMTWQLWSAQLWYVQFLLMHWPQFTCRQYPHENWQKRNHLWWQPTPCSREDTLWLTLLLSLSPKKLREMSRYFAEGIRNETECKSTLSTLLIEHSFMTILTRSWMEESVSQCHHEYRLSI